MLTKGEELTVGVISICTHTNWATVGRTANHKQTQATHN